MSKRTSELYAVAHSRLNKLHIQDAQKEIERVINLSRQSEDISGEIYGKILMARTEWARNDLDRGDEILSEADSLLNNLKFHEDYSFLLAHAYEVKALIRNYRSDYERAFKLWFKLLELTPDLENPEIFLLNAYIGIGDVYQLSGKLEDAEKSFRYAYEYSLSAGDPHLVVKCGLYLASIFSRQNQPRKLSEQLNAMRDYFEDDDTIDKAWQIDYATYRAQVLRREGKIGRALETAGDQIDRSIKYEYYWGLWKASELKAGILLEKKEFGKAVDLMSRTIELMRANMTKIPSDAYLLVSNLYKQTEDFEKALQFMKVYRTRKMEEITNFRNNMILLKGIKARYFNLLLENHFLRWQLDSWKGGGHVF